jgi:hypothetical protein
MIEFVILAFVVLFVVTAAPIVAYSLAARFIVRAMRSSWGDKPAKRARAVAIALSVIIVGGYIAGRPLYFNHVCATEAALRTYETVPPVAGIRLDPVDRRQNADFEAVGADSCNENCRRFLGSGRYKYVEFQLRSGIQDNQRHVLRLVRWSLAEPGDGECREDNEGRTVCLRKEIIPDFSARYQLTKFDDWALADTWQQERYFGIEGYKYYVVDTTTAQVLGTIGSFHQSNGWFLPLFNYWVEMALTKGPVGAVKHCTAGASDTELLALLRATVPPQPH